MSENRVEQAFQWVKKFMRATSEAFMKQATEKELEQEGYKVKRKGKHFHIGIYPNGRRTVDVYAENEQYGRVICECESLHGRHKKFLDSHRNILVLPYWILNYNEIWISGFEDPTIIAKLKLRIPSSWYREEVQLRSEDAESLLGHREKTDCGSPR